MRENVIDRIAEDLRRFRVVRHGYGFQIMDLKSVGRYGGHDRVRGGDGEPRFFRNQGRAQRAADKLEQGDNDEPRSTNRTSKSIS
jgi:hypothetical protein